MGPQEWTEMLQTAGGWGVAVAEAFIIRWLWTKYEKRTEEIFKLLDKQNELLSAVKEKR